MDVQVGTLDYRKRMEMNLITKTSLSALLALTWCLQTAKGQASKRNVDDAQRRSIALDKQGKPRESLREWQKAVELARQVYGPNHVFVYRMQVRLADKYEHDGQLDKAELLYGSSMPVLMANYESRGSGAEDVANAVWGLARVYYRLGQHKKALELAKNTITLWEKLGNREEAIRVYSLIGSIYDKMKDYRMASKYFTDATRYYEEKYGPDDVRTTKERLNIGVLFAEQNNFVDAEIIFRHCLEVGERKWGARQRRVAAS